MQSIISSGDKLHFFEYMEIDILQQYLRTGIHYFINAVLNAYPSLIRYRYFSLEISTLIDFIKDFYYLSKHNASYAQKFYDFQRKVGTSRSSFTALKSALIWTVIPYILSKLQLLYTTTIGQQLDGIRLSKIKKKFTKIYPFLYTFTNIIQTVFKFNYLHAKQQSDNFYNLYYKIDRTHLGHSSNAKQSKYPILQLLKKPGLLMILMGHKIITWYFSQKSKQQATLKSVQEQVHAPAESQKVTTSGKCPICFKALKNPTIVKVTGYVYCYDCIQDHATKHRKCPMSQHSISIQSLQILYN